MGLARIRPLRRTGAGHLPADRAVRPGEAAPKWSSEQPPAAQWTPPAPPGPRAAPPQPTSASWGGRPAQGGWGVPQQGGWSTPPAAAKPGVIPLRPLGIGEILDGAVSTMRAHWRTVLGVTIAVAAVIQLGSILIEHFFLPEPTQIDQTASDAEQLRQSLDSLQTSMLNLGPVYAISLIGTIFTTAVLTIVVSRSVLGRQVSLSDAWGEARPQLPRLVGLSLLLPLVYAAVVTIGILPGLLAGGTAGAGLSVLGGLAAMVVMIWLWVRLSLAGPALMLERQGIPAALRRSAKLVSGAWWRIFGIMLLTVLLTLIVSMIISVPFNALAVAADGKSFGDLFSSNPPEFGWLYLIISGIGAVITAALTYPFSAGVTVLLYVDQRIRREALDIDLARSAGVPGYETSGN